MIQTVFEDKDENFKWVDVVNPQPEDYEILTSKYNLHPAAVKDCLAPEHLPKYERIGESSFVIARIYDEGSQDAADTVQQLTNKVAMFITDEFIITIHRKDEPFIARAKEKWHNPSKLAERSPTYLINQLIYRSIKTYEGALYRSTERLDKVEKKIFADSKAPELIREMYIIKRRASVFKRMLLLSKDMLNQFARFSDVQDPFTQDLIDSADSMHFKADELHENVNNLLNLHLSLASHRTNEVMGVLTIVSMLFLPLTFIVGLYGMNFQYMPELNYKYSYFVVLVLMIIMVIVSYIWFRRKGWL